MIPVNVDVIDSKRLGVELKKLKLTIPKLAECLGISKGTLYQKIYGKSDFYRWEIQKCRELFGKDAAEEIFFADTMSTEEKESAFAELKPCPFCGSTSIKAKGGVKGECRTAWIQCRRCNARTGVHEGITPSESYHELRKEAVAAWNRRVSDD